MKIADFGLSRIPKPKSKELTVKIVTLLYRSPELLLGDKNYSSKVDIWSAGCIFAELLLGEPFFAAAKGADHLMDLICTRLGTPNDEDWPEMKDMPYYKHFAQRRRKMQETNLNNYFFKRKPK